MKVWVHRAITSIEDLMEGVTEATNTSVIHHSQIRGMALVVRVWHASVLGNTTANAVEKDSIEGRL